MAYVAVNKDGGEYIFEEYPIRNFTDGVYVPDKYAYFNDYVSLPKGSIKKLISKELTWEDEPVEI